VHWFTDLRDAQCTIERWRAGLQPTSAAPRRQPSNPSRVYQITAGSPSTHADPLSLTALTLGRTSTKLRDLPWDGHEPVLASTVQSEPARP
jgi:hypothetical protein